MNTETWLLLSLTLLAGAASPGPSMALVVRTSLAHGRLAGLSVALGHGFGVGLYALLTVLGVAEAISHSSYVLGAVQVGGIVFLVYLCFAMMRGGLVALRENTDPQLDRPDKHAEICADNASHFRNGFLIVFLNPKVLIFFLAIFSQFLAPTQVITTQLAAAGLAAIIDGFWYGLIAILISVSGVSKALASFSGYLEIGFGLCLGGVALWMALSFI